MTQPISVVIPVYDGVTQLDFTGPHQFLSRTPDLNVRVASLGGEPVTADLTFSNLEDLTVWRRRLHQRHRERSIHQRDRQAWSDRALPDFGLHRITHFGRCRTYYRTPCGLPLGMARISSGLRRHRRRGPHREGWQYLVRRGRHGRHRFRAGTYRGTARIPRGGDGPTRLGICARTAVQLWAPGHGARRSAGSGERTHGGGLRRTTCAYRRLGCRPSRGPACMRPPKLCAPIGPRSLMDAFRCMVGPRLLPCRHHSAKADKSNLSYDQWSEM